MYSQKMQYYIVFHHTPRLSDSTAYKANTAATAPTKTIAALWAVRPAAAPTYTDGDGVETVVALAVARGAAEVGTWGWPSPIWVTMAAEVGTPGWPSEDSVAIGATVVVIPVVLLDMDMAMDDMVLAGAAELGVMEAMEEAMDGEAMVTPTEPQSCWAKAKVAVGGC